MTSEKTPDSAASALSAGLGALPLIQEGWKLVPMEPTEAMIKASWDCAGVSSPIDGQRRRIAIAYHAMLNAAPEAPNAKSEGAGGGIIAGGSLSTDGLEGNAP